MRRLKILVSYDGTEYHGWQVQPGLRTIESELEAVLSQIEGKPVSVLGSGRTDAGVHALAVCAAFDLDNPIPPPNLRKAMNRLLPPDIRVTRVEPATPDFHPRFNATSKTYEYRIWREEVCPPFQFRYVCYHPYPLNEAAMAEAAALFPGTHDFTPFATSDETDSLGRSKVREIFAARLWREGDVLLFRVTGSGFLKHMVRHMVGFLLEIGKGNATKEDLALLLTGTGKVRETAPAKGLFQIQVDYRLP